MRTSIVGMLVVVNAVALGAAAGEKSAVPTFPVSVGGVAAVKANSVFAVIPKAVEANDSIEVGAEVGENGMVIINAFPADVNGDPKPGGKPAIIILKDTNKGTLDQTMDKKALAKGLYRMNIVAGGKTAIVVLGVGEAPKIKANAVGEAETADEKETGEAKPAAEAEAEPKAKPEEEKEQGEGGAKSEDTPKKEKEEKKKSKAERGLKKFFGR